MKKRNLLLQGGFLFWLGLSGLGWATEDAVEAAIIQSSEKNQERYVELLRDAVNINSGSLNTDGVRQVAELFRPEFQSLGMEVTWQDGKAWNRAGHLVASRGTGGPHFLLIGHLDTVFEPDSPFKRYQTTSDPNIVRGPGVSDMKGGNVVIVAVLQALADAGVLNQMTVRVVLIGDEESSGRPFSKSRHHLISAAIAADVALAFENGDNDQETAVVARRGYTGWQLDVTGDPAHSSQIFKESVGYGAAFELARILNGFRERLSDERYLTFNPGLVLAGTTTELMSEATRGEAYGKANVIAELAVARGDLRTLSGKQLQEAKEKMHEIVGANLKGTTAKLTFTDGYPPMTPTPGNLRLLAELNQASVDLGFGSVRAVDPNNAGAADVSFVAEHVDMALDGLGLLGADGHTVNETADLRTLPIQTQRVAVLMYRLTRDWASVQNRN